MVRSNQSGHLYLIRALLCAIFVRITVYGKYARFYGIDNHT